MSKEFYIKLQDGTIVPVSEDIYCAYKRPVWKEAKRRKKRRKMEYSLEYMVEYGTDKETAIVQKLTEEIVEDKLLLELLMKALDKLTCNERSLIDALYFKAKTEREISTETGIPQKTINNRRKSLISKLKRLLIL